MTLIITSEICPLRLTDQFFAFAEAAVGTIGDQQEAMAEAALAPSAGGRARAPLGERRTDKVRPARPVRLRRKTTCPFCGSDRYDITVKWVGQQAVALGVCAFCGTRCESRHLRRNGM